jgi:hypothetical protein
LLNEGFSFGEIIQDYYPDLAVEDIHALATAFVVIEPEGHRIRQLPGR